MLKARTKLQCILALSRAFPPDSVENIHQELWLKIGMGIPVLIGKIRLQTFGFS